MDQELSRTDWNETKLPFGFFNFSSPLSVLRDKIGGRTIFYFSVGMSVCSGSRPGLFLRPRSPLHLGNRDPCSWAEFHHDGYLLWAVCYGGKNSCFSFLKSVKRSVHAYVFFTFMFA